MNAETHYMDGLGKLIQDIAVWFDSNPEANVMIQYNFPPCPVGSIYLVSHGRPKYEL